MFSPKSLAAATAAFALFSSSTADYNPAGKGNTAVYWGAGGSQKALTSYCYDQSIDIIPVAFINSFPAQANGLFGVGMASNTVNASPKYAGPGYAGNPPNPNNDEMWTDCSPIASALYECQQNTKTKFLLSLGGAVGNYNLNNASDGVYLANLLWGAFGPYNAAWVASGGIRPFDVSSTKTIEFDGFDFDIETQPNNQAGYIAAINQLRILFAEHNKATGCNKQYLITGAPQCPLPDAQMSDMINGAQFDIVWPQFYNNPSCSARNWVTNPGKSGFNFNQWQTSLATGASKDAQLYIGLLGGPQGTSATYSTDYLNPTEAKSLIGAYAGQSKFGGVMLWDAVSSDGSVASLTGYKYRNGSAIPASAAYYDVVKDLLGAYANSYTASAPVCTTSTSSTSSSTSTSSTSSSISTTSSTSSSSPAPASSTSVSAPTTTSGAPVHETFVTSGGITCVRIGCYTEGYQIRALTPYATTNYALMSPEICAANCNVYPYTYIGLEYGGECYCGNQINNGSTIVDDSECNMPCAGYAGEYCGAGNRLDMYKCGPAGSSSTSSAAASTSAATTSYPASSSSSTSSGAASSSYPASSSSSTSSAAASSSYPASSSSSTSSAAASSSYPASSSSSTSSGAASSSYPASSSSSTSSAAASSSYPASSSSSTSSPAAESSSSSYPASPSSSYSSSAPYYPSNSTSSSVSTTSSYPTITSSPGGEVTSTSSYPATITETITTTTVRTITSCAKTVTNCPASESTHTYLVTDTIERTTTYCPGNPTSAAVAMTTSPVEYTTSTVYTTKVYTITSCAPTVTNCPGKIGQVTTETVIDYTTVCPVTKTAVTTPSETDTYSTWTTTSTTTQYITVKVVASTATLKPYPVSTPASILTLNKGAASGTLPAVYLTTTTATPSQFTGAASSSRGPVAVVLAVVLGAVAFLL